MAKRPTDTATTWIGGMDASGNGEPIGILVGLLERVRLRLRESHNFAKWRG